MRDIKVGEIKFLIESPYKKLMLYNVMYKETRNFPAPITVKRLWKLLQVFEG